MRGKRAKELRRLAERIAKTDGVPMDRTYKTLGPFSKEIEVVTRNPMSRNATQKAMITVYGYTAVCLGVRGLYLTLKAAYKDAKRAGEERFVPVFE